MGECAIYHETMTMIKGCCSGWKLGKVLCEAGRHVLSLDMRVTCTHPIFLCPPAQPPPFRENLSSRVKHYHLRRNNLTFFLPLKNLKRSATESVDKFNYLVDSSSAPTPRTSIPSAHPSQHSATRTSQCLPVSCNRMARIFDGSGSLIPYRNFRRRSLEERR